MMEEFSSFGFCVNLLYVVLSVFEPMERDYKKLCDRVDYYYFFTKNTFYDVYFGNFIISFDNESTMMPRTDEINQKILENVNNLKTIKNENQYNFFTYWFFLCSQIIQASI